MAECVLVVDDSSAVRALLGGILTSLGLQVVQAANGEEALALLEGGQKITAILLDWRMKPMDGPAFLARIRADQRWRRLKVLMVSAEADSEAVRQIARLGVSGYIVKPFDRALVAERIAALHLDQPPDPGAALERRTR